MYRFSPPWHLYIVQQGRTLWMVHALPYFFLTISTSTSSSSSLRKWEWLRLHIKHTLHIIPSQHVKTNPKWIATHAISRVSLNSKRKKKTHPRSRKVVAATADLLNLKKKNKKDDDGEDVNARITQVVVGSTLARICDMWYFPISFHKYYNNINVPHIEYFCDVNISQRSVSIYVVHLWRTFFPAIWVLLFSVWFFHIFFFFSLIPSGISAFRYLWKFT